MLEADSRPRIRALAVSDAGHSLTPSKLRFDECYAYSIYIALLGYKGSNLD